MRQTIDLKHKRRRFLGRKELVVVFFSVVLTTIGIKAADNFAGKASDGNNGQPCPEGMVQVLAPGGNFCIDAYEDSIGPDCPIQDPRSQEDILADLDNNDCRPLSVKGVIPWRHISQNQAALACAKAGKRLPTNKEWQQAALGTPDKAADWGPDDCQVDKNWGDTPGKTGSGAKCVSASGAYDMIGNVWEWVQGTVYNGQIDGKDLPKQGYVRAVDEAGLPSATSDQADDSYYRDYAWLKTSGTRGIARGGYWDNKSDAGQYSAYMAVEPSFAGEAMGFRCVK